MDNFTNNNSWLYLQGQDKRYTLPPDLAEKDPLGGVDCGWVEQMVPFLERFSQKGDTVLEPFAGFGSTLAACAITGRKGLGLEIDSRRVNTIKERLSRPEYQDCEKQIIIHADAAAYEYAPDSADLCLTNLPYFGCKSWSADNKTGQLYTQSSYNRFLSLLDGIFRKIHGALKQNRYIVCMAENLYLEDYGFLPMAWDVSRILGRYFELQEERIICYPPRDRQFEDKSRTNRTHEYVLIGQKRKQLLNIPEALKILGQFNDLGIEYLVIGSLAEYLKNPGATTIEPADCDIQISNDRETIGKIACFMADQGFMVYSWQEAVTFPLDFDYLAGRVYLRCKKQMNHDRSLVFDINYECTWGSMEDIWQQRIVIDGIPVFGGTHG